MGHAEYAMFLKLERIGILACGGGQLEYMSSDQNGASLGSSGALNRV